MNSTPRILVFTGDGKGKTTAALGMAFRASGHGLRTCIVQFVKTDTSVGEVAAATADPNIEIRTTGLGFLPSNGDLRATSHRDAAQAGLRQAADVIASREFAIVILDEICFAVACQLVEEEQVTDLLRSAPPELCIVLTGRDASPALVEMADTVTEMLCIKHGYNAGRRAQVGVEL